jgi:hypothetical protein
MSSSSPKPRVPPARETLPERITVAVRKVSRPTEESTAQPTRYPIARVLVVVLRVLAIVVACLWPIESIYIAVADQPYTGLDRPLMKIMAIGSLLVMHFLFLVGLLFWSELLQAFLDIARNTDVTAQGIGKLLHSRSTPGDKADVEPR